MIDMAVVNADVLYCLANEKIPVLKFRRRISCIHENFVGIRPQKLWSSITQQKYAIACFRRSAKQRVRHALERTVEGKQRKGAVCKNNLRKQCIKCNVGLHVNCSLTWHQ